MNNYLKKENWGKGVRHKEGSAFLTCPKEPGERQDGPENRPKPGAEMPDGPHHSDRTHTRRDEPHR